MVTSNKKKADTVIRTFITGRVFTQISKTACGSHHAGLNLTHLVHSLTYLIYGFRRSILLTRRGQFFCPSRFHKIHYIEHNINLSEEMQKWIKIQSAPTPSWLAYRPPQCCPRVCPKLKLYNNVNWQTWQGVERTKTTAPQVLPLLLPQPTLFNIPLEETDFGAHLEETHQVMAQREPLT